VRFGLQVQGLSRQLIPLVRVVMDVSGIAGSARNEGHDMLWARLIWAASASVTTWLSGLDRLVMPGTLGFPAGWRGASARLAARMCHVAQSEKRRRRVGR
jgi:hypothetical protein